MSRVTRNTPKIIDDGDIEALLTTSLKNVGLLKDGGGVNISLMNKLVTAISAAVTEVVSQHLSTLVETIAKQGEELEELRQYTRRNSLRIYGIKESTGENTDRIVLDLCKNKLNVDLNPAEICRTHRLGKRSIHNETYTDKDGNTKPKHRGIIVKLVSYNTRQRIFSAKKKLKGLGIVIREDLTKRRSELLREAQARYSKEKVWSQDGRIFYQGPDNNRHLYTGENEEDKSTHSESG